MESPLFDITAMRAFHRRREIFVNDPTHTTAQAALDAYLAFVGSMGHDPKHVRALGDRFCGVIDWHLAKVQRAA